MTPVECALRLESAFSRLLGTTYVMQAEFNHTPTAAIERSFGYLLAEGIIKRDELSTLLAEYNFGSDNLSIILAEDSQKERILELLQRLNAWHKIKEH